MVWRRTLLIILLAVNLILLYRLVWGDHGWFAYQDLKARYDVLSQELQEARARGLELSRQIRQLKTNPQAQEKAVRDRLNFVREDEILYIFPKETDKSSGEDADEQQD